MVFNATFNNITTISWQFAHKGDLWKIEKKIVKRYEKYGRKVS